MNIVNCHSSWYPTGGDWTYVSLVNKIYAEKGHNVIPFGIKSPKNLTENEYFANGIIAENILDNSTPYFSKLYSSVSDGIYNSDAKNKFLKLMNENQIDVVQVNSIHTTVTLSIFGYKKKYPHVPLVWRMLDYKIICPNRTLLSNGQVCTKCVSGGAAHVISQKCRNNSYSKSIFAYIEHKFIEQKKYYDLVDCFSVQSEFSADMLLKFGVSENRVRLIKNPIEINSASPSIDQNKKSDYILYFGRISKEKGVKNLIEAFCDSGLDLKLLIVGDGPDREDCQNFTSHLQPRSQILFLGSIWGEELEELIRKSLFVVVPSIWYEVSPYVILQSFRNDVPVLATAIGGIPDIIQEFKTGITVSPNSIQALVDGLIRMKEFCNKDYVNGSCINYLKENHSTEIYYEQSMSLFKGLI